MYIDYRYFLSNFVSKYQVFPFTQFLKVELSLKAIILQLSHWRSAEHESNSQPSSRPVGTSCNSYIIPKKKINQKSKKKGNNQIVEHHGSQSVCFWFRSTPLRSCFFNLFCHISVVVFTLRWLWASGPLHLCYTLCYGCGHLPSPTCGRQWCNAQHMSRLQVQG